MDQFYGTSAPTNSGAFSYSRIEENDGLIFSNHQSASRRASQAALDENEDPVIGLERVASYRDLQQAQRRRQRDSDGVARQRNRGASSFPEANGLEAGGHTLSEKYESFDYEIVENKLYREAENDAEHQRNLFRQTINRWIVCFLIGICTAVVAAFVDISVYYSSQLKIRVIIGRLVDLCEHQSIGKAGCTWAILLAWAGFNVILVSVAALLVLLVSPVAAGSGIPQIKCFLNGVKIPGVVRLKTLFAKAVGVACSVGGGLAAGKEGPMIHSGAVVAAGISQGRCVTFPWDLGIFKYFRSDREKRDFVSAGAAAGVAAAFAAPIGGVLFSLEEGASFWNQSLTWRMVFTAMISTFTLNCFLSVFYGQAGWLSWNGLANFGVFQDSSYGILEIPLFMIVGVLGGLFGALFNSLNMKLSRFRKDYVKKRKQKFFEAILVAAASAFIGFLTLLFVNDCKPIGVNPHLTELTKLWCPKGEYSAVANLVFQTPEESVKALFHSPINSFLPSTLLIFAVEYFFLTLWVYGLSVPSGIFIPSLLTGAAWGRLFGIGVQHLFPSLEVDSGRYALAGAAAQLGGIVRMTISLTAIIVEATKDVTFGLPIMIVLMLAKWVGDFFNEGLYDSHIDLAEVPILGWHPPKLSRNIIANTVARKDVIALEVTERVGRIMDILKSTRHHGFPHFTIDREGRFVVKGAQAVSLDDFREFYPRYENVRLERLGLTPEDRRCWIDLRPFMHLSPHRVPQQASLLSIFQLFRGLGLRYLFVVNDENRLRGIITRKDVARFKERRQKNKYLVHEIYIAEYTAENETETRRMNQRHLATTPRKRH